MFWKQINKKVETNKREETHENSEKQLALFLMGLGTNASGMYIYEILQQDNEWWEHRHDFIQWIFPIDEKSKFNKNAPVLQLPNKLDAPYMEDAYIRFRKFLNETNWKEHYHNKVRVTRVLKSLCMFNHMILARELLNDLLLDEDPTLNESKKIWENAIQIYHYEPIGELIDISYQI